MIVKINTAYPFFYSAIPMLAEREIELNIIKSNSPYTLATAGSPDIVIHPQSKVMNGEFPEVKFVGPDCKFPNYEFTPELGYTDYNLDKIKEVSLGVDCIFINTVNDTAFIKYLESKGPLLAIFGKPCDSLYYYGDLEVNSYELYKGIKEYGTIAVDNEAELLKASRVRLNHRLGIMSNFDNNMCVCFKNIGKAIDTNISSEILKNKNWDEIFKNLFKQLGVNYGAN